MKKLLPLLMLVYVLINLTLVNAEGVYNTSSGLIYTDMVYLKTTFVNQNPTSADPGGYVDLLFKIENWGTESAENVTFELLPTYPFSLDPDVSAVNNIGTINSLQRGDNAYLIRYKMKVDKDAVDGNSQIKLKYSYGDGTAYSTQTFDVTTSNPRTDFDVVVQDSTETSTTLAIANIGANTAYSVIAKIPKQENFVVSGTSANIIGNLNAGDYTLTTFQINPTGIVNASTVRRMPIETANISTNRERNLTIEISYTDLLGIRRTFQKEVLFGMNTATVTTRTSVQESYLQISLLGNSGLTYIIIGVVGIVVVIAILKIRKRKKK